MNRLFVDTSAWAAIADTNDDQHQAAVAYQVKIAGRYRIVITNYILDELYTLLLMNVGYTQTINFKCSLDQLIEGGFVEVIWVSKSIAHQAWQVFEQLNVDKLWSFTDCVSYVVMQNYDITEVFSFDRHFSQMGFIRHPQHKSNLPKALSNVANLPVLFAGNDTGRGNGATLRPSSDARPVATDERGEWGVGSGEWGRLRDEG